MGEAAKARLGLVTPDEALTNLEDFYRAVISRARGPLSQALKGEPT